MHLVGFPARDHAVNLNIFWDGPGAETLPTLAGTLGIHLETVLETRKPTRKPLALLSLFQALWSTFVQPKWLTLDQNGCKTSPGKD